jgi:hypothetical protein
MSAKRKSSRNSVLCACAPPSGELFLRIFAERSIARRLKRKREAQAKLCEQYLFTGILILCTLGAGPLPAQVSSAPNVVTPQSLTFIGPIRPQDQQTVYVAMLPMDFTISVTQNGLPTRQWLSASVAAIPSGGISSASPVPVFVKVSAISLSPGTYTGSVNILVSAKRKCEQ